MAGGLVFKDYLWSLGLGFLSFAAGSLLMHTILRPDMSEPDVHDRLTAQREAVREVKRLASKLDK